MRDTIPIIARFALGWAEEPGATVLKDPIGTLLIAAVAIVILAGLTGRGIFRRSPRGRGSGSSRSSIVDTAVICVFLACLAVLFMTRSAVWAIPALAAWAIGYVFQERRKRRHAADEEELRIRNALNHPGVFDTPPPQDLDAADGDTVDIYDAGACTYLGRFPKSDMRQIADQFEGDNGSNDVFIGHWHIPDTELSPAFAAALKAAFDERDYLVLRWMPTAEKKHGQ